MTGGQEINWLVLVIIPIALLVVNIILGSLIGLLFWQWKQFVKSIEQRFTAHDTRIERVKDDLSDFKITVAKEYVSRDDFRGEFATIREDVVGVMTSVDRKLDAIGRSLLSQERGNVHG